MQHSGFSHWVVLIVVFYTFCLAVSNHFQSENVYSSAKNYLEWFLIILLPQFSTLIYLCELNYLDVRTLIGSLMFYIAIFTHFSIWSILYISSYYFPFIFMLLYFSLDIFPFLTFLCHLGVFYGCIIFFLIFLRQLFYFFNFVFIPYMFAISSKFLIFSSLIRNFLQVFDDLW